MPQLMPLNWQLSFLAIFLLIMGGCLVYSFQLKWGEVGSMKSKFSASKMEWFW